MRKDEIEKLIKSVIKSEYDSAKYALNFHHNKTGYKGNIEAAFAAHKMIWIKEIENNLLKKINEW